MLLYDVSSFLQVNHRTAEASPNSFPIRVVVAVDRLSAGKGQSIHVFHPLCPTSTVRE